ncbi:MAG: Rrf2 family transcriptional regulator [Alphaproteobacteria bacterium]|nr:Rrf2 family transcriptional regulator [Alphaproteobacteria bacterium]
MRLTIKTDYSLRVLMYLGVTGDRLVTIQEISECYDISKGHLMKVVRHLGHIGCIKSSRGNNGGIKLNIEPSAINIGSIVRKTEPDLALVDCMQADGKCRLELGCKLTSILDEALQSFLKTLDKYSLADLIQNPSGLASLLDIELVSSEN